MKTKKTGWPGLSGLAAAHSRSPVDHDKSILASGERGVLSIACRRISQCRGVKDDTGIR